MVLVALSGGADSLALAAATAFEAQAAGVAAGAVVVDHGLQAGSAAVAERAASQARSLGLDPVVVVAADVGLDGGPEAAARTARYAALSEVAHTHGAVAVLLGHTLDDQAETVLLGLARGSGPRAIGGMAPVDGLWRRPLLGIRRAQTFQACAAQDLAPWSDPHNDDPAYTRVRVRAGVLPVLEAALGAGVPEALARTADLVRADADALDVMAADAYPRVVCTQAGADPVVSALDVSALDVSALADLLPALRTRVLRRAALGAGCPAGDLAAVHIGSLDRLVTDWHGQGRLDLPGGVSARRADGRVSFFPGPD